MSIISLKCIFICQINITASADGYIETNFNLVDFTKTTLTIFVRTLSAIKSHMENIRDFPAEHFCNWSWLNYFDVDVTALI